MGFMNSIDKRPHKKLKLAPSYLQVATDFSHVFIYTSLYIRDIYKFKHLSMYNFYLRGEEIGVTIYLDAVWLLNVFLDMMLLMLTKSLAKIRVSSMRILCGAFIASLLVPISFFFPTSFFTTMIGKIIYSFIIILCTFGFDTVFRFMKLLFIFYFTTFSIGGGLIAIHFLLHHPITVSSNSILTFHSGYGDPISWMFVLIGFPIIWFFTKIRMDEQVIDNFYHRQLYPVTLQIDQQSYSTTGYMDSGNQLVDPLTKKPVVICDELFLKQYFTDDNWQMLKNAQTTLDLSYLPAKWQKRIHIVPYQGVSGQREFLFAIKPDKLTVTLTYQAQKVMASHLLIGIQFAQLTKDRSYHCLLHPKIIKLSTSSA